tara:strand:- start:1401 stop:1649 length:249 start_codon:yes stop_codon:yes gene_type:complete
LVGISRGAKRQALFRSVAGLPAQRRSGAFGGIKTRCGDIETACNMQRPCRAGNQHIRSAKLQGKGIHAGSCWKVVCRDAFFG